MSTQTVEINIGSETEGNLKLTLTGEYTPYDPGRMYYPDGSGQPPEPASFEVEKAEYKGVDVMDLLEAFNVVQDVWEVLDEKGVNAMEGVEDERDYDG